MQLKGRGQGCGGMLAQYNARHHRHLGAGGYIGVHAGGAGVFHWTYTARMSTAAQHPVPESLTLPDVQACVGGL